MQISLTRGSWKQFTVTFNWGGEVKYNPSFHKFTFFASSKRRNLGEPSYEEVIEIQKYLADFFIFDFYEEAGVKCVMFHPKEDCKITFK